jgi:hypothetical protein
MKFLLGFFAALLLVVLSTTVDVMAQTTYYVGNNSPVATCATIQTSTCGTIGPVCPGPGVILPVAIPAGCTVTGIWYRGVFYPATGTVTPLPPPNPPNSLIVTIARAVFLN